MVVLAAGASLAWADEAWESLPDGSQGLITEYQGVGGVAIAAYIRKPAGNGPFPVVILGHGGPDGKQPTYGMGRSPKDPTAAFVKAGWVVYSIDYRHADKVGIHPIEYDDTVEAVKAVRKLPYVDAKRVGYMGGSHGAQVGARLVSRADLSGAVLCAPAAMDLVETKKAIDRGEKLVAILTRLIGDMEKEYGASAEEIDKDRAKYHYASPIDEVAKVRCPLLLINGKADDNSPVSIVDLYVKRLRAAGKQVETYEPDGMPHGFYFGRPEGPEYQESTRRAVEFLRRCFKTLAPMNADERR